MANFNEHGRFWKRTVEGWPWAPFHLHWNKGGNPQQKDKGDTQGRWPLKLPQQALAGAIWAHPEGSPPSLWRMSADSFCTLSFHLTLPHADFSTQTGLWLPFRVCLLHRYLLINFKTVRSKNWHQRCLCYLETASGPWPYYKAKQKILLTSGKQNFLGQDDLCSLQPTYDIFN